MLDLVPSTRINSDASEDDLKNGEYRDALNITLMAFEAGAWSKGTTYGNIDTNIVFQGLQPDAICLGTAIDTAGRRVIIIFYQTIPVVQEVLMYLIPEKVAGILSPLVKSSLMQLTPESYLDGYSFVNELFYFNFRESAPKMINIDRALDSPGFYDNIAETSLTVIRPHPPLPPIVSRSTVVIAGQTANLSMMKKPFQFMTIYRFMDG